MREMAVSLEFSKHCLGNVKRTCWEGGKRRSYFLLPRSPSGKVIFLPTWWTSVLIKAAEVFCRHQDLVKSIKFSLEVEGSPQAAFHRRYIKENQFSKHEAFFPGDVVNLTCLVPESISDEDLRQLLSIVGKYYGISPGRPNEYGFFTVLSVRPYRPRQLSLETETAESRDVALSIEFEPSG